MNSSKETNLVDSSLPDKIKKWVVLDSQLKLIHEKTKTIRDMRNGLETEIIETLDERNMLHKKIGIGNGGELKIVEKKEYGALTYGYIEECLAKLIPDTDQVDFVIQYIKNNRPIKIVKEIKRKES
jgi:hypothetical protein